MKSLVIFYTRTGNTEVVASKIAKLVAGDLIQIEEIRDHQSSFLGAAFGALIGRNSKIKPTNCSLNDYDTIFIGSPVWASRCTPAVNSFISKADLLGKKVYLFFTLADHKLPDSMVDVMKKKIGQRGGKVEDSFFVQTKMKQVITSQMVDPSVSDWLKQIHMI